MQEIWRNIGNGDTTLLNFAADIIGSCMYFAFLILLTVLVGGPKQ